MKSLVIGIGLLISYSLGSLNIPIKLRELHGVNRINEPVSVGVPLPKGLIKNKDSLSIQGSNWSQVKTTMYWPDSSLRWVVIDFQTSLNKYTEKNVFVVKKPSNAFNEIVYTQSDSFLTVNTGKALFTIRKKGGFNLFQEVKIGNKVLVQNDTSNGSFIEAKYQNKVFKSNINDSAYSCVILDSGKYHSVVRVEGFHKNVSLNDNSFYGYTVYYHFYSNSSLVKVQFISTNIPFYYPRGPLKFLDWTLTLKHTLNGSSWKMYSSDNESGVLDGEKKLLQLSNTSFTSPTRTGQWSLGWASVNSNNGSIYYGMQYFKELYPKALRFDQDKISLSLFPKEANLDYYLLDQAKREHRIAFTFDTLTDTLNRTYMEGFLNHPLRGIVPPDWVSLTHSLVGDVAIADSIPPFESLPLINDIPSNDPNGHGWYRWGGDTTMNNNEDREIYHKEANLYFTSLKEKDWIKWDASVQLDGLKPYHLQRTFDPRVIFPSPYDLKMNYWYYPDSPRRDGTPLDVNHFGTGTIASQRGWLTLPQGWKVQDLDHMDSKHILDRWCVTGDYANLDMLRSAGMYRGAMLPMRGYFNTPAPPAEFPMSRATVASLSNLVHLSYIEPTSRNITMLKDLLPHFQRSLGPNAWFDDGGPQPYVEALNAHLVGQIFEVTQDTGFLRILDSTKKNWPTMLRDNGFVPFYQSGQPAIALQSGTASSTSVSNWRFPDGAMTMVQYFDTMSYLAPRIGLLEASKTEFYGKTNSLGQKYFVWQKFPNCFRQNGVCIDSLLNTYSLLNNDSIVIPPDTNSDSSNCNDTLFIHDTVTVINTIHDTITVTNIIHDTTTLINTIHDTTIINNIIRDTIVRIDTLINNIHDTTIQLDTVIVRDTVIQVDTLVNVVHDTITIRDTILVSDSSFYLGKNVISQNNVVYKVKLSDGLEYYILEFKGYLPKIQKKDSP